MTKQTIYEGRITQETVIAEMSTDGLSGKIDVPVDADLLREIVGDDASPMFVTIEVAREGKSRNNRYYGKKIIQSMAEQINSRHPDGYMGHLTDDERSHKFPEPQTIWLGATAKEVNGKAVLFAKGYVLPEAKSLRSYLRKAKAAGKNVAVSVYGKVRNAVRNTAGVLDLTNATFMLESVDWARPGSEGFPSQGQFMVTAEMVDNAKGEEMTKEEVVASLTADELKDMNPELVAEMTTEAVEAAKETVVSEMTAESDKAVQTIAEMQSTINQYELKEQLRDKVRSPAARKVIEGMVLSEMTDEATVAETVDKVLASESGKAVISEMIVAAPKVAAPVDRPVATARKYTNKKV